MDKIFMWNILIHEYYQKVRVAIFVYVENLKVYWYIIQYYYSFVVTAEWEFALNTVSMHTIRINRSNIFLLEVFN